MEVVPYSKSIQTTHVFVLKSWLTTFVHRFVCLRAAEAMFMPK